jgi:hypothetical protein
MHACVKGMAITILCAFPDCWRSQSTELKVEMVALHEKRVRKCLSKVKGTYVMSAFFS